MACFWELQIRGGLAVQPLDTNLDFPRKRFASHHADSVGATAWARSAMAGIFVTSNSDRHFRWLLARSNVKSEFLTADQLGNGLTNYKDQRESS
jgi:hypothetical protein